MDPEKNLTVPKHSLDELSTSLEQLKAWIRLLGNPFQDSGLSLVQNLEAQLWSLQVRTSHTIFQNAESQAKTLADTQGKKILWSSSGADIDLPSDILDSLSFITLHLVRNAVDHGIETPLVRKAQGLADATLIDLSLDLNGTHLVMNCVDFGRGPDFVAIEKRAIEMGLLLPRARNENQQAALLNCLFHPQFSTKKNTTEISGRGMGLSAVKSIVEKYDGKIQAFLPKPTGLGFEITIPLPVVGFYAVPLKIGAHQIWVRRHSIRKVDRRTQWSASECADAASRSNTLGANSSSAQESCEILHSRLGRLGLLVEDFGAPEYRLFHPLDSMWALHGPDWVRSTLSRIPERSLLAAPFPGAAEFPLGIHWDIENILRRLGQTI